ncbi:helix-turn-helix domain-containing protein (plasmid) [Ensifer sp. PDNC004]|uniref:helix-turn-helix domain-containing protein n=1 Tax=Ensifer sp. PDNC004 TaxID=2811423 RepID=UPI0019627781|nr:helix-turn-helix domain-containing protein [Ensifer sp. PDNC004]QRY70624.1 helix-turn-helix domain-containing protein [Ensifer sp. PDNC004]
MAQHRTRAALPLERKFISRPTTLRVVEGCVALYRELGDGRRLIPDVLGPGRLFGSGLVDVQDCRAMTLAATSVETFDGPPQAAVIDVVMRQMLLRAQAHAILLGRKTAAERVATALLDLASQFARKSRSPSGKGKTTFNLHLTRADLADWLGLTLETVSRCLGAFKRGRLIAFDHPEIITIRDRTALEALAAGNARAFAA